MDWSCVAGDLRVVWEEEGQLRRTLIQKSAMRCFREGCWLVHSGKPRRLAAFSLKANPFTHAARVQTPQKSPKQCRTSKPFAKMMLTPIPASCFLGCSSSVSLGTAVLAHKRQLADPCLRGNLTVGGHSPEFTAPHLFQNLLILLSSNWHQKRNQVNVFWIRNNSS